MFNSMTWRTKKPFGYRNKHNKRLNIKKANIKQKFQALFYNFN